MRHIIQTQLDKINTAIEGGSSRNDSFLTGKLGLIFYYFHLYKATGSIGYSNKAEDLLDDVMADLHTDSPKLIGASFGAGGSGLGYVMNFLLQAGFVNFDIDREFADLDQYIFNMAMQQVKEDFIDYLYGAIGAIHYFSARNPTPRINDYLDNLILAVCNRAVREDAGYWFRNYLLRTGAEDYINFGLSHGLSGILLVMLNTYERSSHKPLIRKVVLEGIRFIRKYKMDIDFSRDEYSFFPNFFRQDAAEISGSNRLGWCYGDLNHVLLFYRAGKAFNFPELIQLADLIGTQSIMRKDAVSTLVQDSSFCHGTSGLAQFYRSIYLERPLPSYKLACDYWTEQTVIHLDKDLDSSLYCGKEHELLDGLLGVAFPLLSYLSDSNLEWSKSLLL